MIIEPKVWGHPSPSIFNKIKLCLVHGFLGHTELWSNL